MTRFYTALLIIALVINAGVPASAEITQGADSENIIYTVRDSVLSYFYPLSGVVVGVEDGAVKISLKKEERLKKGMRFSVFRVGEPFYHPTTKELMGKTENFIGRIEVKDEKAHDGLYLCTIVKGGIKPGDIVRITSSRIKLAFFQDRKSDWTLSEAFYGSLKDSGRFNILESYALNYEPDVLSKHAKELGAEAVLMFSTPSKDKKRFLNVRLYWAEDAKIFAEFEKIAATEFVKGLILDEEFISISLAEREPWSSYELASGELIALGDVNGSGTKELIVSDGNDIRIYSMIKELQEIWFIKGKPDERHLSIDILDFNNNGRAEIFVTSLIDESSMSSYVVEYDPSEGYKKIWDKASYFLRIQGKTLLMQKFSRFEIFSGPVFMGKWEGGHYEPDAPLKLPEDVNIYGFTFIDWQNKGDIQIMTFDNEGYLNLYDNSGQLIWKSSEKYGKFDLSFEKETHSIASPIKEWVIRDRLISVSTERGEEVIVPKKILVLSQMPGLGIKGAEVYSLWWDGGIMDENLILRKVSGAITGYWVEGKELYLIARGGLFSFAKKALSGEFSRPSILYYYNFERE